MFPFPGLLWPLLNMPRGLVVYAGNNSKWRAFAYYKNGNGSQYGVKEKSGGLVSGKAGYRYYDVKPHGGGDSFRVVAAKTLDEDVKKNPAYDPTSGTEVGYFNWEPLRNSDGTIKAKPDSTGEFSLIGKKMRSVFSLPDHLVQPFQNVHDDLDPDGTKEDTRKNFFQVLKDCPDQGLTFFAYAGHGGTKSLPSACVREKDIDKLVEHIRRIVKPDGTVIFYACNTGKPGGFASQISQKLPGMKVWGHSDAGQASRNADKLIYQNGQYQDIRDLIDQAVRHKFAPYLLASADFYVRLPFMAIDAVNQELQQATV